ncbi:cytidylate kinase [Alkaliphilus metalliredigens QYMF]|uniref:Cytidylate kinase n=1 Tax=Alkaliphilus metalliredigens (strain QYMF) TaxID=293826 RepID=KCY_ALKMQ|nr:(d)CMP kinase [Alkaliphilus metalliredigens]A6TRG1.1 RecName: Full=Cytidylate kinase; Short=CK; AltName: Full=Cytidine monophosphate kinase; Short=CMP kinase [Alkaliphilus metalliredigens QYMF]ABR48779.1 cytidylate kinase [Alkaliphilus metalliredigens QYMF]
MTFKQIAIDGPAGAGKSTVAKKLAALLGYTYVDSGAMYRALTYWALKNDINIHNVEAIVNLCTSIHITFINQDIAVNNQIVNTEIRSPEVNNNVSHIAKIPEVRKHLVSLQKCIALSQNVIMDGRDIGTHVLPDADIKVFLTASTQERAQRRYIELVEKGIQTSLMEVEQGIIQRDQMDSKRQYAPLTQADDAVVIDSTGKSIDAIVEEVLRIFNGKERG